MHLLEHDAGLMQFFVAVSGSRRQVGSSGAPAGAGVGGRPGDMGQAAAAVDPTGSFRAALAAKDELVTQLELELSAQRHQVRGPCAQCPRSAAVT